MLKFKFRIDTKIIPIYMLLLIVWFKWLFEGILGSPTMEMCALILTFIFLMLVCGANIRKSSVIWCTYILNIIISTVFHASSLNTYGRAVIMIVIACIVMFGRYSFEQYKRIIYFIVKLGLFSSVLIFFQFMLRERFNNLYFPRLVASAQDIAKLYYRSGYFFGVQYNPHEPAGFIVFAISSIVLGVIVYKKCSFHKLFILVWMLAMLLLTGKKGVLFVAVLIFILTLFFLYSSENKWGKIFTLFVIACLVFIILRIYIATHSDNVFFYRIEVFLNDLTSGEDFGSGRNSLYAIALSLWKEHKLLGIGWKQFAYITISDYGYLRGHEVNNDYLQWLCETGIVGLTLNLLPIIVYFKRTINICHGLKKQCFLKEELPVVLFAIFLQFFTIVYALVEIPFYDIVFFTLYILSCLIIDHACNYMKNAISN